MIFVIIKQKRVCLQWHTRFVFYTPMHEVTPKVVAIAVSTVITMFRILLQSVLFVSIV